MRASIRMKWGCRIKSAGAIEIGWFYSWFDICRPSERFVSDGLCVFVLGLVCFRFGLLMEIGIDT